MTKDITNPDILKKVHENDEGTGIYWLVDANLRYEQSFIPSITRKRANDLAADFGIVGTQELDDYRWIPNQIENIESLVTKPCSGSCKRDIDCVDNACRCIGGQCRRK
jgi:hypothetical protein